LRTMKTSGLTIYRRKLPHWRLAEATYFVTWRLARNQPLLGGDEKTLVVEVLRHFEDERYTLPAHVVMDDHVHVLVFPLEGYALHRIVHSWKSFSAKQLAKASGRTAPVWQREYLDRIVRSD